MTAVGAEDRFDLAVVGAGVLGLAHALAAARAGLRVCVIERDLRANGASIRNFGFVTVTGQERGAFWALAKRSRDVWAEVAGPAGIPIEHRGLVLAMRRPEAVAVARAFLATEMGEGCALLDASEFAERYPELAASGGLGALESPHELRVDSVTALPKLADWLAREHGVEFRFGTAAWRVAPPILETSRGSIFAQRAVVCPGDDFTSLFPERLEPYDLKRCRLTMLRLASPGFKLRAGLMSDLGLTRYRGYSDLPEARALKARIAREQPEHLAHGVHLIAVQSADGSLVVGDSHHYGDLPAPYAPAEAETLILDEFARTTGLTPPPVIERWTGTYAVSDHQPFLVDAPAPNVRLVIVTTGAGASTAFGIAEQVIGELCGALH